MLGYLLLSLLWSVFFCTNDRDSNDPRKQAEMLSISLRVGDLAPIPKKAVDRKIWTEGNRFTRTFHIVFRADPKTTRKWLQLSPGISKAAVEKDGAELRYILKPREGWNRADVLVDPKGNVHIHVEWS